MNMPAKIDPAEGAPASYSRRMLSGDRPARPATANGPDPILPRRSGADGAAHRRNRTSLLAATRRWRRTCRLYNESITIHPARPLMITKALERALSEVVRPPRNLGVPPLSRVEGEAGPAGSRPARADWPRADRYKPSSPKMRREIEALRPRHRGCARAARSRSSRPLLFPPARVVKLGEEDHRLYPDASPHHLRRRLDLIARWWPEASAALVAAYEKGETVRLCPRTIASIWPEFTPPGRSMTKIPRDHPNRSSIGALRLARAAAAPRSGRGRPAAFADADPCRPQWRLFELSGPPDRTASSISPRVEGANSLQWCCSPPIRRCCSAINRRQRQSSSAA